MSLIEVKEIPVRAVGEYLINDVSNSKE